MERASEHHFKELSVVVPCCHRDSSLNNLIYEWDAAFARFSIEFSNPLITEIGVMKEKLEEIFSCSLKMVFAHY